jgi:hypothetical protein
MRYFPGRARKNVDIASLLRVCPQCLGDLEHRADVSGEYFRCIQCNARTEPRESVRRLPRLSRVTPPVDVFPTIERTWPETATG